jgi:class 3 adenylate cyclase
MSEGVNIVARLQTIAQPGAVCPSEQAYWRVKQRLTADGAPFAAANSHVMVGKTTARSGPA